jgi:hypothetical protein
MRTTEDEEDETVGSATTPTSSRPAWMVTLKDHAGEWLKALPEVSRVRLTGLMVDNLICERGKLAAVAVLCA